MKYALAVLCPPYALWDAESRGRRPSDCSSLAFAISGGNVGVVHRPFLPASSFGHGAVGHQDAHREAQEFVRGATV